jgi:hypothetical protein
VASVLLPITGFGFTVTVTVNVLPGHGPAADVGVTVYTTLIGAFVEFNKVPLVNEDALVPDTVPLMPVTTGADHVYVVLAGTIVEEVG